MDPVTIANEATLIYDNITKNSNAVVTRILSLYDLTATKEFDRLSLINENILRHLIVRVED